MSQSLHWRPKSDSGNALSPQLKTLLWKRYGGLPSDDWLTLSNSNTMETAYLQGLSDAGIPGAEELLQAIVKHESVEIKLL